MFLKDRSAKLDYHVDWSEACAAGLSITQSSWVVEPVEIEGLIAGDGIVEGWIASCHLEGGQAGNVYRVENAVVLSDGRSDARSLTIRVEDR
jgi:hypothetical protein